MKQVIVFAYKFGNNSFKFSTESTHFIIASIIVNYQDLEEFYNDVEKIGQNIFRLEKSNNLKLKTIIKEDC